MEELSQEYLLTIIFNESISREDVLEKKCINYLGQTNNKELKDMLKDMKKLSEEHVEKMKDKMIKLKIIR